EARPGRLRHRGCEFPAAVRSYKPSRMSRVEVVHSSEPRECAPGENRSENDRECSIRQELSEQGATDRFGCAAHQNAAEQTEWVQIDENRRYSDRYRRVDG